MVKRRKGPPARSSAVRRNPERAEMVTESRPPENVSEPENDVPALETEVHTASVHDALLETVSADALEAGTGQHATEDLPPQDLSPQDLPPQDFTAQDAPVQDSAVYEPVEAAETVEAITDEAEPAAVMQPPEALEATPDAIAIPDVTPEPEAVPAAGTIPEAVAVAAIETIPASVALPVAVTPDAILRPTTASFDVIGEITEVNATILAFLRNEGSAAMAHWQSLSGAKTPADAIRIQVDEMQRAADASLTCFNVLARRAGRLAVGMGRA